MKLTRRQVIQAGANLAGASLISPILAQSPLNTTIIPSSGQQVPSVGIGCRNYRGSLNSDEMPVFTDTLSTFHRLGGKVVDTSPNYGNSEEIIGTIMRELDIRNELWVATKVDREDQATGIARMERSFKLLAGDSFELMQVHNLRGVDIQLKTMSEWIEQGRFRYIGVTTSSDRQYEAMAEVMNRHTLDFIQIDYSLGNRNADDRLLPMALDKGIACLLYTSPSPRD